MIGRMAAAESTAPELTWYDPDGGRHSVVLEPSRTQLTIGRRPESEVALPWDTEVSRAHARLERVGRDWTIRDDGLSRNGTWLNGRRVHGSRRLVHGDIIRVGRTMLTVMARRDGESLPTAGADRDALQTASAPAGVRVHLCGPLILERGGERLDSTLPGRQG